MSGNVAGFLQGKLTFVDVALVMKKMYGASVLILTSVSPILPNRFVSAVSIHLEVTLALVHVVLCPKT